MTQLYADELYIYICGETMKYYDILRKLGGGKWRPELKCWRFPKSKYAELVKLFGEEITSGSPPSFSNEKQIKLIILDSQIHVSGDTYNLKNCFKHMGGVWDQDHWVFAVDRLDLLRNFIRLGKVPLVEEQMPLSTDFPEEKQQIIPPSWVTQVPPLIPPQIPVPKIVPPHIPVPSWVTQVPQVPVPKIVPPHIPVPKIIPPQVPSQSMNPQFVITKSHKGIWACHISPIQISKVPGSKWNATRKCYIYSVKKDLKSLMSAFGLSENDFYLETEGEWPTDGMHRTRAPPDLIRSISH